MIWFNFEILMLWAKNKLLATSQNIKMKFLSLTVWVWDNIWVSFNFVKSRWSQTKICHLISLILKAICHSVITLLGKMPSNNQLMLEMISECYVGDMMWSEPGPITYIVSVSTLVLVLTLVLPCHHHHWYISLELYNMSILAATDMV